jgi:hypothetical protein
LAGKEGNTRRKDKSPHWTFEVIVKGFREGRVKFLHVLLVVATKLREFWVVDMWVDEMSERVGD